MRKTKQHAHNKYLHRPVISMLVGVFVVSALFSLPTLHRSQQPMATPLVVASAPTATPSPSPAITPTARPLAPAPLAHTSATKPTKPVATPAPALASTVKYPNLPDYPHPVYTYSAVALPSGPLYTREGFLNRVAASAGFDAASAASSNPGVTVAVIDTGFALQHEVLANRWATNAGESGAAATDGIDNDNDGFIDNYRGWDFIDNANEPYAGRTDTSSSSATHGTLTSGLATVLNPNDKILPLQALDDDGYGNTNDVAAAVRYAADHGAKIINLSLGASSPDDYLREQVDYAISKGSIVVAAAGNSGCNCMLYPAAYPEVIAVGASTTADAPAYFSSYGSNLDVLGPGTATDVCSAQYTATNPTTAYTCNYYGTSLASPIVAGLVSLLAQQCPYCSSDIITQALITGVDPISGMTAGTRSDTTGYGRINVLNSVNAINQFVAGDFNHDGNINVYDLAILLNNWGTTNASADINGNGVVDVYDLSILLRHWTS